jgi:hypothetical protein
VPVLAVASSGMRFASPTSARRDRASRGQGRRAFTLCG